jgi:hypothetical protein
MWETLLEDFELFFVGLPDNVRDDLSFMMVVLGDESSDESVVVNEVAEVYERASQGLFKSKSRIGRVGDLINAVSIMDVYFAMDVHDRFDADKMHRWRPRADDENAGLSRGRYAREIDAIETARQHWLELRTTKFTPAAIATALIPPALPRQGTQLAHAPNPHDA